MGKMLGAIYYADAESIFKPAGSQEKKTTLFSWFSQISEADKDKKYAELVLKAGFLNPKTRSEYSAQINTGNEIIVTLGRSDTFKLDKSQIERIAYMIANAFDGRIGETRLAKDGRSIDTTPVIIPLEGKTCIIDVHQYGRSYCVVGIFDNNQVDIKLREQVTKVNDMPEGYAKTQAIDNLFLQDITFYSAYISTKYNASKNLSQIKVPIYTGYNEYRDFELNFHKKDFLDLILKSPSTKPITQQDGRYSYRYTIYSNGTKSLGVLPIYVTKEDRSKT